MSSEMDSKIKASQLSQLPEKKTLGLSLSTLPVFHRAPDKLP